MKPQKSYLKLLLIILGIVIIASGLVYYFGVVKGNKGSSSLVLSSPSPAKSVLISPGASSSNSNKTSNPSGETPPSNNQNNNDTNTPNPLPKTFTGKVESNAVPSACNPVISFNYPESFTTESPYNTPNSFVGLNLRQNGREYARVDSAFEKVLDQEPHIYRAVCKTYNSLQDYTAAKNLTISRNFTTTNGYSAAEWTNSYGTKVVAVQGPDKNIILISPNDDSTLQIANSIKF